MNTILLLGVSLVYCIVGFNYYSQHQYGLALTFGAYALANIGLWMAGDV